MSFMENHNLNLTATLSPSEPQVTNEEEMVEQGNNNVVTEAVGVDAGSDTGRKSEAGGSGQGVKRGRGRPRKNGIGGNQLSLVSATPPPAVGLVTQDCGSDGKRGRGRPRGSGKLQILASLGGYVAETAGGNLTPHVLTVNPGEDVVDRIFTFFHKGPRAVCVLSANGTISNVTLRQPGASGGVLSYEGRFEILNLTGSSTYGSAVGGANRRSGMLTVTLAKPDGKVFGGVVESSLIAANPIQLILATFKQSISNQIKRRYSAISTTPNMSTEPDSARDHHSKVPKLLTEGESNYPSPISAIRATTIANNGVAENVIPETVNEVSDNVTAADQSDSDPVRGIDLDSETLLEEPVADQRTSPDVDANASSSVPQI